MIWKDRLEQYPHRYTLTNVSGSTYDFTKVTGEVNESGTPVNAENLNKLIQRDGDDIKDTVVAFTEAGTRANIGTGESTATLFGKIKKYFTDLKPHAFNDLAAVQGMETDKAPTNKLLTDSSFARVYRSFNELTGITTASTVGDIVTAMGALSVLLIDIYLPNYPNLITGLGTTKFGTFQITVDNNGNAALTLSTKPINSTTTEYYTSQYRKTDASNKWSGWKQVFTTDNISTVMPLSSAAASNEKVLGEKVVYDEFALKANAANPTFTGQITHGGNKVIGTYPLYASDNINYNKFAEIQLFAGGNGDFEMVANLVWRHTNVETGVNKLKFNFSYISSTFSGNIIGLTSVIPASELGTFYYTFDVATKKVALYYKTDSGVRHTTLSVLGISTLGTEDKITFAVTDTGSTSAPATPSGGYAGSFVYTDYKQIATTDNIAYDKVIRTQTEFDALIASPTWLGATSVALVGQFTLSTANNSGIKIPSTVKQIHGFNGAKITVTNFVYNATTAKGGLWYDTRPTTLDYSIRDLEVDCTGTGTGGEGCGFYFCTNLTNCTGTGIGTAYGYGFRQCTNLTNCTGTGTGTGTGGNGNGFHTCTNLTNCTGTGTGRNGNGFNVCTNLTNCTGTGTGTGYGYGFAFCTNLTNCKGTGNSGFGFYEINYASNCKDGGSSTAMWGGVNVNIDLDTCRKTPVTADNSTLNT